MNLQGADCGWSLCLPWGMRDREVAAQSISNGQYLAHCHPRPCVVQVAGGSSICHRTSVRVRVMQQA